MSGKNRLFEEDPMCPHCGEVDEGAAELFSDRTGDVRDTECAHCDKQYRITRDVTVTYNTYAP